MQNRFDPMIKGATCDHLPKGFDWRLVKAQLIAESNLIESARSPVGALGIAQFMPDTWECVKGDMGLPAYASCDKAQFAIPGCCFYMRELWDDWIAPREWLDHYCLTAASYNAGFGNLLKAQQLTGGANDYASIIGKLPIVTGRKNAWETTEYVERILRTWIDLVIGKKG